VSHEVREWSPGKDTEGSDCGLCILLKNSEKSKGKTQGRQYSKRDSITAPPELKYFWAQPAITNYFTK
jgi:hypothetical protein